MKSPSECVESESLRMEKTSKIPKSNHQPIPTMPTARVPQCHIYLVCLLQLRKHEQLSFF